MKVVMLRLSIGWFVGGEIKLSILKEIVVPAVNDELATDETVTRDPVEEEPAHWMMVFKFYFISYLLVRCFCRPLKL